MFRIFGRDAGFSALFAAYVTSARCVIPEAPYDLEALARVLAEDHRLSPSHYAIVVAAEGAIWKGAALRSSVSPTRSGTGTRRTSARRWPPS